MRLALTVFAIAAMASTATFAATAATMKTMDTDHNGSLSLVEIQAVYPKFTKAEFTKADTNGDGKIDAKELAAAQKDGVLPAQS